MRQRPTLPGRLQPSTIGVLRLNFCVRNGNRWNPQAITTAMGELFYVGFSTPAFAFASVFPPGRFPCTLTTAYELSFEIFSSFLLGLIESTKSSYRPISIIKLHALLHFHR